MRLPTLRTKRVGLYFGGESVIFIHHHHTQTAVKVTIILLSLEEKDTRRPRSYIVK